MSIENETIKKKFLQRRFSECIELCNNSILENQNNAFAYLFRSASNFILNNQYKSHNFIVHDISEVITDYNKALDYAKYYVENGVNGTYAIISKIDYDNEYYKLGIDDTLYMVQTILGGSYIEEYHDIFGGEELYKVDNIVYSLCKEKNKEHPYYLGKGNGKIIEDFIKKS